MRNRRATRRTRRTSQHYFYSALVGMAVCIVLLSLAPKEERAQEFGILFLLLAAVGGFFALRRWQQARQTLREAEARQRVTARRAALRKGRKVRDLDERIVRMEKRAAKARALADNRARRLRESEMKRQAEEALAIRRAAQEAHITAEVARLRSLTPEEYVADVAARFVKRGFSSVRPTQEPDASYSVAVNDLFLEGGTVGGNREALETARLLPPTRIGNAEDVHALEAWRRDVGASRAWLVSLAGFTPEAALVVGSLPLLLIDAEILASWSL